MRAVSLNLTQVHKFLVTHASYPNEDAFVGTLTFCLLMQKLVKSCGGDRRQSLTKKYPKLCQGSILRSSISAKNLSHKLYLGIPDT
jgi:hypothetical protein